MIAKKPEFVLNQNLRFVPKDAVAVKNYINLLKQNLDEMIEPLERVNLFGEIGVYLRSLDQFDEAENYLLEALKIIATNDLGIPKEVQQKIRLAHVWQEKKEFNKSNNLFAEVIKTCRNDIDAGTYIDFALQHAGKNCFDQGQFRLALDCFSEALDIRTRKNSPPDQVESSQAAIRRTQELLLKLDPETLKAYSKNANEYSEDWLNQPEPGDMYDLLKKFFWPGGETVDIGCGNGRDANWLAHNGYKVIGYDASSELLKLASDLYSDIQFHQSFFPSLREVQKQFDNVVCETVIMHLPKSQIPEAIQNLKRILKDGGVLYLSWRVSEEEVRHADGRLYSALDPQFIVDQFSQNGILHFEDKLSESSGKRVCRIIFKKEGVQ